MKTDMMERQIQALGTGELQQEQVSRHLRPLFSRSLQHSRDVIYLANHSLGRALDQTEADVIEGLGYWYTGRENAWEMWLEEVAAFRRRIATLIHAPCADCVVPRISAGQGLRSILNCYDRPIRVISSADEFNSIDHILKNYARHGRIKLEQVKPKSGRFYRLEDFLEALREGDELLVVSMVLFTTGQLLTDLPALITAAHDRGVKVVLDLYHAVGAVLVDVAALDADFALGGSYKYLRGGPGAAWLYLHPRHLDGNFETLDSGWFAEPDPFAFLRPQAPQLAKGGDRFLESTPAVLPFYQARAGQQFTLAVGVARLHRYSLKQQLLLEELLQNHGIPYLGRIEERGAFIAIPHRQAQLIAEQLEQCGVIADAREGLLRLCPDVLTTQEELVIVAGKLAEIWKGIG